MRRLECPPQSPDRLVLPVVHDTARPLSGWLVKHSLSSIPGTQWVPWVHIDDVVGMIMAAIDDDQWTGAVNTVAPGYATMKEIAMAIGRELRKPAALRVPGWALKLLLGEFADALLVSQKVSAERAKTLGYAFAFPDIASALHDLIH